MNAPYKSEGFGIREYGTYTVAGAYSVGDAYPHDTQAKCVLVVSHNAELDFCKFVAITNSDDELPEPDLTIEENQ